MHLPREDVIRTLDRKGNGYLYHANTIRTSCTFLANGGLLSRGAVEARGLQQTPQRSDGDDRRYGVWDDIWLDGVDIHAQARRENVYGPVLFIYAIGNPSW
jgi:hypothetical protein